MKIEWTVAGQLFAHIKKDDVTLALSIVEGPDDLWAAVAVETPTSSTGDPQAVFDNHNHKVLGKFDLATALKKAAAYAKQWKPTLEKDHCPCPDAPTKPTKRGRSR